MSILLKIVDLFWDVWDLFWNGWDSFWGAEAPAGKPKHSPPSHGHSITCAVYNIRRKKCNCGHE
jgi:hypothetical protein